MGIQIFLVCLNCNHVYTMFDDGMHYEFKLSYLSNHKCSECMESNWSVRVHQGVKELLENIVVFWDNDVVSLLLDREVRWISRGPKR